MNKLIEDAKARLAEAGHNRFAPPDIEDSMLRVLGKGEGAKIMDWLRTTYGNRVSPFDATTDQLMRYEGRRDVVGILDMSIASARGRKNREAAT